MSKINLSNNFKKSFEKRIKKNIDLRDKYLERTKLFISDRGDPILKDHKLTGKKEEFRAFSVTGDVRVVYYIDGEDYCFVDIGTHNQVYK